jgi:hypothetical protein
VHRQTGQPWPHASSRLIVGFPPARKIAYFDQVLTCKQNTSKGMWWLINLI